MTDENKITMYCVSCGKSDERLSLIDIQLHLEMMSNSSLSLVVNQSTMFCKDCCNRLKKDLNELLKKYHM